jgi:hypothetical protein
LPDPHAIEIVRENMDVQTGLALRSVNSLMMPVRPRAAEMVPPPQSQIPSDEGAGVDASLALEQ